MCLAQQVSGWSSTNLKNLRNFANITHPITEAVAERAQYMVQIKTASQSVLGTSVHIHAAHVPPQSCCLAFPIGKAPLKAKSQSLETLGTKIS